MKKSTCRDDILSTSIALVYTWAMPVLNHNVSIIIILVLILILILIVFMLVTMLPATMVGSHKADQASNKATPSG